MKALSIIRVDHVGKNPHIQFPQNQLKTMQEKITTNNSEEKKLGSGAKLQ